MTHRIAVSLLFSLLVAGTVRADFAATHGLSSADFQTWFDDTVKAGYRVVQINGYDAGGTARFAAVAVKEANAPAFVADHDMTSNQYQAKFNALTAKGYRLSSVSGYANGGTANFAGVWVKDAKAIGWEAAHNLTSREYQDRVTALEKKGMRPDVVSGYGDGTGGTRLAATWVDADNTAWVARHDQTAEQYQKAFDELAPKGYRPTSISVYPTDNGLRFAIVFVKDNLGWSAKHDLTADGYQAEFDRQTKAGFRPLMVTGYGGENVDAFDAAMKTFMKDRSIKGGTLAVSQNGKLLLSRGHGSLDAAGQKPMPADAPFRLASIGKPITAAAVRDLIRAGKLTLDTRVFPLLGVQLLPGRTSDARLNDITVKNLLEHRGGWDRDKAGDPMFKTLEIAKAVGKPGPAEAEDVIRYMVGQPLQFDPGSQRVYSNFGYCVLGRVIEKVTGQGYTPHIQQQLAPLGVKSLELGRSLVANRNPREPVYLDPGKGRNVVKPASTGQVASPDGTFYLEAMDAPGGLIASAPDLIRFLDAYWISGEKRQGGGQTWLHFGSLPGTWTMMQQRPNGMNVVALFSQRTDPSKLAYEKISEIMGGVADGQGLKYAVVFVKDR